MLKICKICSTEKDISCFSFRKDSGKYRNECKLCVAEREKLRRSNNREEYRQRDRVRNKIRAENGKLREMGRRYRVNNKEKVRAAKALYKYRKKQAIVPFTDKKKLETVYAKAYRFSIWLGTTFHVDHIIPIKSETVCGLHVHNNLQIIKECDNLSKGNLFKPEDFEEIFNSESETPMNYFYVYNINSTNSDPLPDDEDTGGDSLPPKNPPVKPPQG